jgi:hypothetical protein
VMRTELNRIGTVEPTTDSVLRPQSSFLRFAVPAG